MAHFIRAIRIADVEVVAVSRDVLSRHEPGALVLGSLPPPCLAAGELVEPHRPRLRVLLATVRWLHLVKPRLSRGTGLVEEQEIRRDCRVWLEGAIREPDHRVEIALHEQLFLDSRADASAEEHTVRHDDSASPPVLQLADDQLEE